MQFWPGNSIRHPGGPGHLAGQVPRSQVLRRLVSLYFRENCRLCLIPTQSHGYSSSESPVVSVNKPCDNGHAASIWDGQKASYHRFRARLEPYFVYRVERVAVSISVRDAKEVYLGTSLQALGCSFQVAF